MTSEHLTTELAVRAMGWRLAPGRYLKPEGGWTSRSGFLPLVDVKDAFRVLDAVTDDYSVVSTPGGRYAVQLRVAGRTGEATGKSKARAISLAVAQALAIDVTAAD